MSDDLVQIAVEICTDDAFKRTILSGEFGKKFGNQNHQIWDRRVEQGARNLLQPHDLPENDQNKVLCFVFSIALRMLTWTEYHIGTFGLSRDFCIDFFDDSLFAPQGIIDYEEVSLKISKIEFSNKQGFLLACYYCHKERISDFFNGMTEEEKATVFDVQNPENIKELDLVKYWAYHFNGEIKMLLGTVPIETGELRPLEEGVKTSPISYALTSAKDCGSRVAIEYFLSGYIKPNDLHGLLKNDLCVDLVVLRTQLERRSQSNYTTDWIVFTQAKYNPATHFWVPDHFLIDSFYYVFSRLTEVQKSHIISVLYVAFRRRFETGLRIKYVGDHVFTALHHFLCCPYQEQFFHMLKLSWKYLPLGAYANILQEITDRILSNRAHYWDGENRFYDYRKFLIETWTQSPDHFKRYIFDFKKQVLKIGLDSLELKGGIIDFLLQLCRSGQRENRAMVLTILSSATPEEKEGFLQSDKVKKLFFDLVRDDQTVYLEQVVAACSKSTESAHHYKICLLYDFRSCLHYARAGNLEAAREALRWPGVSEADLPLVKHALIKDPKGKTFCRELGLKDGRRADDFIMWCLGNEESVRNFKIGLLYESKGIRMCENFVFTNKFNQANLLVSWAMPSVRHIQEYRKQIITSNGKTTCNTFDVMYASEVMAKNPEGSISQIIDWSKIEILFKWGCDGDVEIENLKKEILVDYGDDIVLRFVSHNKCAEADKFLTYHISSDKWKEYKNSLFYGLDRSSHVFENLLEIPENNPRFANGEGKGVVIENFLKWFLVDKEAVKEFKDRYRLRYTTNFFVKNAVDNLMELYGTDCPDQNA